MGSPSHSDRVRINKQHWNSIAASDWEKKASLRQQIRDGTPYLEQMEPKIAPYLKDIRGKKVIVLQFGDGLVMLACAQKGALVTGVDFSSEQVRLAKKSAQQCGVKVKLVKADCQHLPESIPNSYFDLAVAECGIFIWVENLDAWMRNAWKVLRKGGKLVVSDFHPLSLCAKEEKGAVMFKRSYFDQQPHVYEEKGMPPSVERIWKLSDIINAAINAGFHINRVEEYYAVEKPKPLPLIPTDFLLIATKP
jgi:ubiquinone/menaquinone biosynthesis C-methylase UbiE